MSYTTVDETLAFLPKDVLITAESDPSLAEVNVWIPQVEARVDVAMSAGGEVVPATDATQKKAIAVLCAGEVAYMVQFTRSNGGKDFDISAWTRLDDTFNATLKTMQDGKWSADEGQAGIMPNLYTMNAPDNPDSTVNPVFRRDQ